MPEKEVKVRISVPFEVYFAMVCAAFEAKGYLSIGSRVERGMADKIVDAFLLADKSLEYHHV